MTRHTSGLLEVGDLVVGREACERVAEAGLAAGESAQRQRAGRSQTLQLQHRLRFLSEQLDNALDKYLPTKFTKSCRKPRNLVLQISFF